MTYPTYRKPNISRNIRNKISNEKFEGKHNMLKKNDNNKHKFHPPPLEKWLNVYYCFNRPPPLKTFNSNLDLCTVFMATEKDSLAFHTRTNCDVGHPFFR